MQHYCTIQSMHAAMLATASLQLHRTVYNTPPNFPTNCESSTEPRKDCEILIVDIIRMYGDITNCVQGSGKHCCGHTAKDSVWRH